MALSPTKRTWKEGDQVNYQTGSKLTVFAGLYFYSGFGCGDYFSKDGKVYWGSSSEASKKAEEEGIQCKLIDSFNGYKPVYLGD